MSNSSIAEDNLSINGEKVKFILIKKELKRRLGNEGKRDL